MALMVWSEHFVTGIGSVDAQHKGLVDLINQAAPHLAQVGDAPASDVRPLLDQLAKYAAVHFQHEEALMRKGGLDAGYRARHEEIHASFAHEVTQMVEDYSTENSLSGSDLLRFLTGWLSFHILSEDQYMARQLRATEAGLPHVSVVDRPEAHESSANAVLVNALVDLFSMVSKHNRTLKSLNESLREAQNELRLANEQLEVRVAERTRELKAANAELKGKHKALADSLAQVKQAQSQLLQSEKAAAIGQLAAGVAHEINNPIGFVTSNLASLGTYATQLLSIIDAYEKQESGLPPDAPLRAEVARVRALADIDFLRADIPVLLSESSDGLSRVARIVSDLKDFSHVGEAEWQDADLNYGLESTLNLLASQLKYQAAVVKEFGKLPPVRCMPSQLNQVFMNLLMNAVQAIDATGLITLRTRVVADEVLVQVSDTGCGIPAAVQKRIFEPFFTTRPVGKGVGLGLSVAWDVVKQHHGRIDVTSREGEGATFTIALPVTQGVANESRPR